MIKTTRLILLTLLVLLLTACALPASPNIVPETESAADSSVSNEVAEETAAEGEEADGEEAAAEAETADEAQEETATESAAETFTIDPAQSEARYTLNEDLRGNRVTVVGVTSAISGEMSIDSATPANTQIGPITIDAASFVTDSGRRDGAVQRFVLVSGTYPTITFAPTSLNALPENIAVGDTVSFEIRGDLTLKDQTQSEIFKITITVDSAEQISGAATSTIAYANYGIFIPDVPFVANVDDELQLDFDFVAVK